jgi:hypothetical protein
MTAIPTQPRPVGDLRLAAMIIRQVAGAVDPALRVALEAEARRLDLTVRNVRDARRVHEGDGA